MDSLRVKAQLRLAAQRLGQLQAKKDSQGQITRRDIATLLQQGNVSLARAKAQKLNGEDAMGDVLEVIEMHIGVILQHFSELERSTPPSPIVVEAASTIIYAAPHIECKELHVVSQFLSQQLGPDFSRSAVSNRDNYVLFRVVQGLNIATPSVVSLNEFLHHIARSSGVQWSPESQPHDRLNALSEILDPSSPAPVVDMHRLRSLCVHGIPDHPPWLRPRIWRLLLGTLPVLRIAWDTEAKKQRDDYYDLVRQLLEPFSSLPPPTSPLAPLDDSLMKVSKELSRVPSNIFAALEDESEPSDLCPLDEVAPHDIRLACANNLSRRLGIIQRLADEDPISQCTPEIRLETSDSGVTISVESPDTSQQTTVPTTLHPSKAFNGAPTTPRHSSALLRLLYIHSRLNPANRSPHLASLLVPLYTVLTRELEIQDLAHVEADTFWVFEAMVGEFSELEDEEGGSLWMQKFGECLAWADEELSLNLRAKGLDPALPHYSYRWLAPLLTHTLPLNSVFSVWDALFSRPLRDKNSNFKLDYLIDVCTSMLIRAKGPLLRLGKSGHKSPSLWSEEHDVLPPPSPLRAWELSDAFLEGMSLLQVYPIGAAGGIDTILQTAFDLARRREDQIRASNITNVSLGTRLKETMWRGFTNQVTDVSPDEEGEEEGDEDGNETETEASDAAASGLTSRLATSVWNGITNKSSMEGLPSPLPPPSPLSLDAESPLPSHPVPERPRVAAASGLTSRFANTVWMGITNQSSMESPISPLPPPSPLSSSTASPGPSTPSSSYGNSQSLTPSSIWGYAEKLKDTDTAAALAKASTNWTARALQVWNRTSASDPLSTPSTPYSRSSDLWDKSGSSRRESSGSTASEKVGGSSNRGSLFRPGRSSMYSPPPRPEFFRPPRDSMLPESRRESAQYSPTNGDMSPQSESGLLGRSLHLQTSLASLTGLRHPAPQQAPRSGPRPLLLSSSSLMTGTSKLPTTPNASTPHHRQWSEVMQARGHNMRRVSQTSSSTSLSVSDVRSRHRLSDRSEGDSDTAGSRVIPLHKVRSPMAPSFRAVRERPDSTSSAASDETGTSTSPPALSRRVQADSAFSRRSADSSSERGWGRMDVPDSPATLPSSPPPRTPTTSTMLVNGVNFENPEHQRGSVVLSESNESPLEHPMQTRKVVRKKTPPPRDGDTGDTSDSSAQTPHKSPRSRTKRVPVRPAALLIQQDTLTNAIAEQKTPSPNTLAPAWSSDHDVSTTPRAATFASSNSSPMSPTARSPRRLRKISTEGREVRTRKISSEGYVVRTRKISTEGRRTTESAAEEGDDEGYDDLLSAYESEDGTKGSIPR